MNNVSVNGIIEFNDEFDELAKELDASNDKILNLKNKINTISSECDEAISMLKDMPNFEDKFGLDNALYRENENARDLEIKTLNNEINELLSEKLRGDIILSYTDHIVCIISSIIATLIDVVLVGTPNINSKNGNSLFINMIRNVGNGNDMLSDLLKVFSDKCKVSYDISALKNTVYPKNHRLRSFAHDSIFGLLFAILDIKFGTCTLIDNQGEIVIIPNTKGIEDSSILMCIVYYIGHILSDVCTSQGIPIPGFCFTQFFSDGSDKSFAKICERMYVDGYDLRHLALMSTPVFVKNTIIESYYRFFIHENTDIIRNIAEKEIDSNKYNNYKNAMFFLTDLYCGAGNIVIKFISPPNLMNPASLNLPMYLSLIKSSIAKCKYVCRDKTIENIELYRQQIDKNWKVLLE